MHSCVHSLPLGRVAKTRPFAQTYYATQSIRDINVLSSARQRKSPSSSSQNSNTDSDVEIFSLEGGWNVEALTSIEASSLLDSLEDNNDDDEADDITFSVMTADDDDDDDDEYSIGIGGNGASISRKTKDKITKPSAAAAAASSDLLKTVAPHVRRRLETLQEEADAERERVKPAALRRAAARFKTHKQLRVMGGFAAGKRLISPQGDQTRPMMEMVRGAVFDMINALSGGSGQLPEGSRWLDLFAGTGAVGIEALSRGCSEAHFVELSPWVITNCLAPNLIGCGVDDMAIVHGNQKAEDFLQKSIKSKNSGRFAGGAFDFMSICPPYEAVSYTEVLDLVAESPLLGEDAIVVVEYPRKCVEEIREELGHLVKLKDRRYGRTFVAIYGPKHL